MKFKNMKRIVALGLAMMMAVAVVPASAVSAKTKYKTVKEDGKQYIVFGSYEQDGDESNGKEPIEWEVLGKDKNGILVVSRYILDCQPYNEEWTAVTWKTCTLRKWLNKKFYNTAFNAKEQKKINTVKVKNAANQRLGTDDGKNTKDKIFSLSLDEIMNHYSFNEYNEEDYYGYCQALIVPSTSYAKNKGIETHSITEHDYNSCYAEYGYTTDCIGSGGVSWWLRSTAVEYYYACIVGDNGLAGAACGDSFEHNVVGVRPAMYLKK